ncbi:hypothetical protein [Nostoc sp. NMS8]|uniref:hypothetical protein n=1 Tax=Nostoc sp. NMS8 TaxID=2815392 RepID=UPI0025DF25CD|nr:hypothetical protein [Nostoc sp. NMS8]MBN3962665.1 hypothetical protein [Nostoc sp. NMS8]
MAGLCEAIEDYNPIWDETRLVTEAALLGSAIEHGLSKDMIILKNKIIGGGGELSTNN